MSIAKIKPTMRDFLKKLKILKNDVELSEERKDFIRENLIAMIRKEDDVMQAKEIINMRKKFEGEPTKIRKGDDRKEASALVKKRKVKSK